MTHDEARQVVDALRNLAFLRSTEAGEETLAAYTAMAEQTAVHVPAFIEACRRVAVTERAEGEPAFPAFGTLAKMTRLVWQQWWQQQALAEDRERRARLRLGDGPSPELTREEAAAWVTHLRARVAARVQEIQHGYAEGSLGSHEPPIAVSAHEPTFRCLRCFDNPAGWQRPYYCPETPCERPHAHPPHVFSARCPCWLDRQADALSAARQAALQTGRPLSADIRALDDYRAGVYRWARPRADLA